MKPCFLVVDKPVGLTSHDVVGITRAVTGLRKVGHTGTLDPFAEGVLPLALGPATRLIQYLDEDIKIYDATIALGAATDTGDRTGKVSREAPVPALVASDVEDVLETFKGIRMQKPPMYSAVKHKGRPLYAYAREGREVEVEARPRRIDSIDLLDLSPGRVRVRIQCGRGTYARVLADEIATALGSAGHLDALRRTRSGPFHESACLGIEQLSMIVAERKDWQIVLKPGRSEDRVPWRPRDVVRSDLEAWVTRPLEALGHLPRAPVSAVEAARIRSGGSAPVPPLAVAEGELYLAVEGNEVIAVARREASGPRVARVVPR